eukprot:m.62916 g.62916  ORF g.62916 m.62916 type:complete len:65 (-) comp19412_c0_seq1:2466-2660(-)
MFCVLSICGGSGVCVFEPVTQKFMMIAPLDDLSILENKNHVRPNDGAKAMGNTQGRTIGTNAVK